MTAYYRDENVTLYHGDCRDVGAWTGGDVLVTDPPYGVDWSAGAMHSDRSARALASPSIIGDHDTSVRDAVLASWGSRPAIVFGSWRMPRPPAAFGIERILARRQAMVRARPAT